MNILYVLNEPEFIRVFALYVPELNILSKVFWELAWVKSNFYSEGDIFLGRVTRKVSLLQGYFVDFTIDHGFLSCKEHLNEGDVVPVQVKRISNNVKGALLSNKLSIRYGSIIIILDANKLGKLSFGNKIPREKIRQIKSWFRFLPQKMGQCIIRSSSVTKTRQELIFDYRISIILAYWLRQKLRSSTKEISCLVKISPIYDFLSQVGYKILKVIGNSRIIKNVPFEYVPQLPKEIKNPLIQMLNQKVYVGSNVSVYIEKTELGWTIDVNSGSNFKANNLLKINMNCVRTIFEHIFLRNMSGFILIDFINMNTEWEKLLLEEELRRYSQVDSLKVQIYKIEEHYLAILVRQNLGQKLNDEEAAMVQIFLEIFKLKPGENYSLMYQRWNMLFNTPERLLSFSRFLARNQIKLRLT